MSSLEEQPVAMSTEVMAATIAGLQAERAEMAVKVASLEESLTDLAHENAMLKRRLFGSKTERFRTSELQLALGDLLAAETKLQADLDASIEKAKDAAPTPDPSEDKGKARPQGRRNLLASNLPRVPVEIRDSALEARGARLIRYRRRRDVALSDCQRSDDLDRRDRRADPADQGQGRQVARVQEGTLLHRGGRCRRGAVRVRRAPHQRSSEGAVRRLSRFTPSRCELGLRDLGSRSAARHRRRRHARRVFRALQALFSSRLCCAGIPPAYRA